MPEQRHAPGHYDDAERDGDPVAKARADWLNGLPPLSEQEARDLSLRKGPHRRGELVPPRTTRALRDDLVLHGQAFLDAKTGRRVPVREVTVELNGPTRVNGIPVEVERAEWTDEGLMVTACFPGDTREALARLMQTVEDATPAITAALQKFGYAAAEVAAHLGQAASRATPKTRADNEPYVKSSPARQPVNARLDTGARSVTLPSLAMNGLGREHITDHQVTMPAFRPGYVQIPEALGGLPEDAPERHPLRPNRAERRHRDRKARRRG